MREPPFKIDKSNTNSALFFVHWLKWTPASCEGRSTKSQQARLVAADKKQSPIALYSNDPSYASLENKPLHFDYPPHVENLRLSNTGIGWQVKVPYQLSMQSSVLGGVLPSNQSYKLDQFHCHWSVRESGNGSEHSVDDVFYSAELHFVHYNMEKYHSMSMAARQPDGLVVVAVFLDAQRQYPPHQELEKVMLAMRNVQFRGEHAILRTPIRLDRLLPRNKSYWTYSGSLTTPPYYESVQWFVLKQPVKCSRAQTIDRFEQITSSLRVDERHKPISCNCRLPQPLNDRPVAHFDEWPSKSTTQTAILITC